MGVERVILDTEDTNGPARKPEQDPAPGMARAGRRGAASAATGSPETDDTDAKTGGAWPVIRRLGRDYLLAHRVRLTIAVIAMFVIAATTVASAWLLQPAVDRVLLDKDLGMLWTIVFAVIVVFAAKAVAMVVQGASVSFITQRVVADMQKDLFSRLMHSDLSRFTGTHSGRFSAHLIHDAKVVTQVLGQAIIGVAKDGATATGLILFVYIQDFVLAFIATVVLPLIGLMLRRLSKRVTKAVRLSLDEMGNVSSRLSETLDGVRIVKAYGREAQEIERVSQGIDRHFKHQYKALLSQTIASPMTEFITGIALGGVLLYGGYKTISGDITPGAFVAALFAIGSAYRPLRSLARLTTVMSEGVAAAERLFGLIDVEPEIKDRPGATVLTRAKGHVRLDDVHFHYADGSHALKGVTLDAPAGSQIALVGPSGAGKSTVLNMIPRFYDASNGRVSIDGEDIRDVTIASLRAQMALVTQDPFLFDDTIRANIAYARPDIAMDAVERAARDAAAHEFIERLPEGYDTMVGEQGVRLSGGQKQRIAIARALLADTPVLLLDEATSALDTESERQVQLALSRLMEGRTTIVIAHRLSTIMDADRIYALEDGRVAEEGTHAELLAQGGLYARLYQTQFDDMQKAG